MAMAESWRVGGKIPLNVYLGDRPMFQCHTPEDAAMVVRGLNSNDKLLAALKGLLALNEKQFSLLEESVRRGMATFTPKGVQFDDLKFVKLSKVAIAEAEKVGP